MSAQKNKQITGNWWVDADNIDPSLINLQEYVVETSGIFEFVNGTKHVVVAPKGFGKTLLLRYIAHKHDQLSDDGKEAIRIPSGIPLDTISHSMPPAFKLYDYLDNLDNCTALWQLSIGISLIINYAIATRDHAFLGDFINTNLKSKRRGLIDVLLEEITTLLKEGRPIGKHLRPQSNPSSILRKLLDSNSQRDLDVYSKSLINNISQWCLAIDQPVRIYIDRIDQGARHFPVNIWKNLQGGLVCAIETFSGTNRQIKIYASIRKEAWNSLRDSLRTQFNDLVVDLSYSDKELQNIFSHAISVYEDISGNPSNPDIISQFIGSSSIHNSWSNEDENVFRYILRHTLRRPRDVILIGKKVHAERFSGQMDNDTFKKIVNTAPATELHDSYIEEELPFTDSFKNMNENRLCSLLKSNIYSFNELVDICEIYNAETQCIIKNRKANGLPASQSECRQCPGTNRIFTDLYKVGLLGIVETDETGDKKRFVQHFERVGRVRDISLPVSRHYLLHPAMDYFIKELEANKEFRPIHCIKIGHREEWKAEYEAYVILHKLDQLFTDSESVLPNEFYLTYRKFKESISDYKPGTEVELVNSVTEFSDDLNKKISTSGLSEASSFLSSLLQLTESAHKYLALAGIG
ncbi:MAG: hypothetical protein AB2823_13065 [Candidatus Thiodiazotropha endolucinida]